MPGQLIFTTVPSGLDPLDKTHAIVTIHVAPQLAVETELTAMQQWTSDVASGRISFFLQDQTKQLVVLTPRTDRLRTDLWAKLFSDLPKFQPYGSSSGLTTTKASETTKRGRRISDSKVNLKYVLDSATSLHKKYVPSVDVSSTAGIKTLRDNAVATVQTHSLFGLDPSKSPVAPGQTQTLKDFLADPTNDPSKNLTVRRIFGGVNVATAFPDTSKVYLNTSAVGEIKKIHNGQVQSGGDASHILHQVHRLKAAPRRTPSNIVPNSLPSGPTARDPKQSPMSFHQRLSVLLNMPLLLEALGLVIEFTVPKDVINTSSKLQVQLVGTTTYHSIAISSPFTFLDSANCLPSPAPASLKKSPTIAASGYIDVQRNYHVACLQPEAAGQQVYNFANQAAQRLNSAKSDAGAVTQSLGEDYVYPILPKSPHTDGLYVYQHDRQRSVDAKLQSPPDPIGGFYAEDLFHSYAVDVRPKGGSWANLTIRNEAYEEVHPGGATTPVVEASSREHGIRTSASRPTDTINSGEAQDYLIDEVLFTWRKGSLAFKDEADSGNSMKSQNKEMISSQSIPWGNEFIGTFGPAPNNSIPDQRFGQEYDFSMRPIYLTGRARPFDSTVANSALISIPKPQDPSNPPPNPHILWRNEMVLGPHIIRRSGTGSPKADTDSLMFVASEIKYQASKPPIKATSHIDKSLRYLVPSATTAAVARRHGKPDLEIKRGSKVLPLTNGALPTTIPATPGVNDKPVPYLPDPMCDGVVAKLKFIGNVSKEIASLSEPLSFYSSRTVWPQYILHGVELQRGDVDSLPTVSLVGTDRTFREDNPAATRESRIIVCTLPPGMTAVLELTPHIADKERGTHYFGDGKTRLEDTNICRPSILRMTHATDLPVSPPTIQLGPSISSTPPSFDRLAQPTATLTSFYEPYSTSKEAVEISWIEATDDPTKKSPTQDLTKASFFDRSLPKIQAGTPPTYIGKFTAVDVASNLTLPLPDSRYRRITLTDLGIPRFADVFPSYGHTTSESTYDVLSTSAPPVPDVECVIPTLEWSLNKETRTRAMGVAVVLNRPWYASGAGEQLAVVLSLDATTTKPTIPSTYSTVPGKTYGIEDQVTSWGTHAIWQSVETTSMQIALANSQGLTPVMMPDKKSHKTVALYTPTFNEPENRWFCNLSFTAPPVYGVLLRLVLARYQRYSVDGSCLSPTVLTEFSFLGPNRTLVVKRSIDKLDVTISGPGTYGNDGSLLTIFEVRLATEEDRDKTDFNWREDAYIMPGAAGTKGSKFLWQGSMKFYPLAENALVIREFEIFPDLYGSNIPSRKLVYADVVYVPPIFP